MRTDRAVFRGPTKGYTMSDTDVEWLARSLWGEASTEAGKIAVAWSHMNRFLLVNYVWLKSGWPFWRYMQSHSQPINPEWLADGKFCEPGGKYHGNSTHCSTAQLRKREKYQTTPYAQIPKINRRLAEAFAAGEIENPFNEPTYDFAACWLTGKQNRPNPGIAVGGNCHLTHSSLKPKEKTGVVPGEVVISGKAPSSGTIMKIGGAVCLLLLTWGGYVLWKG